jgi:hypothetical protein
MEMDIKSVDDIGVVADKMHDSEFCAEDFGFDSRKKFFYLKTHLPKNTVKKFILQICNVEKYDPINLDKIQARKATGGVFNTIKIKDQGRVLEILSQDLKILLKLSKLEGSLEMR